MLAGLVYLTTDDPVLLVGPVDADTTVTVKPYAACGVGATSGISYGLGEAIFAMANGEQQSFELRNGECLYVVRANPTAMEITFFANSTG